MEGGLGICRGGVHLIGCAMKRAAHHVVWATLYSVPASSSALQCSHQLIHQQNELTCSCSPLL